MKYRRVVSPAKAIFLQKCGAKLEYKFLNPKHEDRWDPIEFTLTNNKENGFWRDFKVRVVVND